ncbi:hypothetical protein [Pandoravirus japonicus]|uniref:Uncharacterized protein n=1 Tax=Pandoravirus japonicus TaxID=2823154 RepID=A0A811BM38_9VIRU|nr:hypothetical protein [Pandoravirus japonicus]
MDDDYAQPDDLLPPSPARLDRVRDELGPWRNHSAVHAVIVDGDEGLVRVTFEVFTAIAAKCELPEALWLGALRGCRVAVHHRPAPDDATWAPTSLRVLDQRCRSVNVSPSTPRSFRSSPPLTMATSPAVPAPSTAASGDPVSPAAGAHVADDDDDDPMKVEPDDTGAMPPATAEPHV